MSNHPSHSKSAHTDSADPCAVTMKPAPLLDTIVPPAKPNLLEDIMPYATCVKIKEHKRTNSKSSSLPPSDYNTIYGMKPKTEKLQSPTSSFVVGAAPYGMRAEQNSPLVPPQQRSSTAPKLCALCKQCGQSHAASSNHLFDYHQPVDEDLTCHICLQPLVDPVDTKCGHTFCYLCLHNYLRIQSMCPVDRSPVIAAQVQQSSIMVRR